MICPVCRKRDFERVELEVGLEAERCVGCRGVWLTSARYFGFLAAGSHEGGGAAVVEVGADSSAMKLCPTCGKFMRWYEIGHGVAFGVDRCGTCGGMWLNAGEWETLRGDGLHVKLHFAASDAWQGEVARLKRRRHEEEDLARRLGEEDFRELRRFAEWMKGHMHRDEMAAYLREWLRE